MEVGLVILGCILILAIFNTERQATNIRRDVARLDRKLNALLKQSGVEYEDSFSLSERVKEIARHPGRKIEAIKLYREETGAGLADAKETVEAFIRSMNR